MDLKMNRPNIIFVLADEHRWDCLGYAGNPDVRTPNFDALAANGVNFSQAICPFPLCVPSRTSLMTGQYVGTHGVDDFGVAGHGFPNSAQGRHRVRRNAVVVAEQHTDIVCVGTNDSNVLQVSVQWQHAAIILEQDHRLAGSFQCECLVLF